MGVKKGQTRGENAIRYYPRCKMCDREFPAKDPRAKCCSNRCRIALSRWTAFHGRPPRKPPKQTHTGYSLVKPVDAHRPKKGPPGR